MAKGKKRPAELPEYGTTDESGKSEREDQRTDRTDRTKRIILSIFIIEKGTHSRCLFFKYHRLIPNPLKGMGLTT